MRFLSLLSSFIVLLSISVAAQTQEELAKQTGQVVNQLYDAVGSELGAYFFEPEVVLCFGGKQTKTGRHSYKLVGNPNISALNKICEPLGARIVPDDENFGFQSKPALGAATKKSKLTWMEPFDSSGDWEDFEAWEVQVNDKLKKVDAGSSTWEVWQFMAGSPDSAILSERECRSNKAKRRTLISSNIAYSEFLDGDDPNFSLLPAYINSPDNWERYKECSEFLTAFYNLPSVRARLISPDFTKKRQKVRGSEYIPKPEKWLRGGTDPYLLHLDQPYNVPYLAERVLAAHADELAHLFEEKALTGSEIAQRALDWGLDSKPRVLIPVDRLDDWIWAGGYGFGSYRDKIYQSLMENHPSILTALTKQRLDYWLKRTPEKEEPSEILGLFIHSGTKEYFATLDQATKDKIRARMEKAAFDRDVRILLGQPPYSL